MHVVPPAMFPYALYEDLEDIDNDSLFSMESYSRNSTIDNLIQKEIEKKEAEDNLKKKVSQLIDAIVQEKTKVDDLQQEVQILKDKITELEEQNELLKELVEDQEMDDCGGTVLTPLEEHYGETLASLKAQVGPTIVVQRLESLEKKISLRTQRLRTSKVNMKKLIADNKELEAKQTQMKNKMISLEERNQDLEEKAKQKEELLQADIVSLKMSFDRYSIESEIDKGMLLKHRDTLEQSRKREMIRYEKDTQLLHSQIKRLKQNIENLEFENEELSLSFQDCVRAYGELSETYKALVLIVNQIKEGKHIVVKREAANGYTGTIDESMVLKIDQLLLFQPLTLAQHVINNFDDAFE